MTSPIIKHKRSSTPAAVPTLAEGQIAVNMNDLKIYFGPSGGGTGVEIGYINSAALTAALANYLLEAGGIVTGDIVMSGASIIETEGAPVASADTCDIWATDGNTRHITGSTGPITSFGTASQPGIWMKVIFDSTPTLTQGSNLNLNTGGSITVEADDFALVYADTTTQHDVFVFRKSGMPSAIITDARLLGRSAGSAGVTQQITVGAGLALAGGALTANAVSAFETKLLHVRHVEATPGTDGGTYTTGGVWQTRPLNTAETNEISGASLASNQVTLPAGTYYIDGNAPSYGMDCNKLRIQNITDTATLLLGPSSNSPTPGGDPAQYSYTHIKGRCTISGVKVIELQHIGQSANAGDGFGVGVDLGSTAEVFADLAIWKVA